LKFRLNPKHMAPFDAKLEKS